jgi:hypothetical protein
MKQAVKNMKDFNVEAGLNFVYFVKNYIKQTELHNGM